MAANPVKNVANKVTEWFFKTHEADTLPLDEAALQKLWAQADKTLSGETDLSSAHKIAGLKMAFERILAGTHRHVDLTGIVRLGNGGNRSVLNTGSIFKTREAWIDKLKDGSLDASDLQDYRNGLIRNDRQNDLLPYFLVSAQRVHPFTIDEAPMREMNTYADAPLSTACSLRSSMEFCKDLAAFKEKVKTEFKESDKAAMRGIQDAGVTLKKFLLKKPSPAGIRQVIQSTRDITLLSARLTGDNEYLRPVPALPLAPSIDPVHDSIYQAIKKKWDDTVDAKSFEEMRGMLKNVPKKQAQAIMGRAIHECYEIKTSDPIPSVANDSSDLTPEIEQLKTMGIDIPAIIAAKNGPTLFTKIRKTGEGLRVEEFQKMVLLAFPNAPLWMLRDIN